MKEEHLEGILYNGFDTTHLIACKKCKGVTIVREIIAKAHFSLWKRPVVLCYTFPLYSYTQGTLLVQDLTHACLFVNNMWYKIRQAC